MRKQKASVSKHRHRCYGLTGDVMQIGKETRTWGQHDCGGLLVNLVGYTTVDWSGSSEAAGGQNR
jgi:hypothetical protein